MRRPIAQTITKANGSVWHPKAIYYADDELGLIWSEKRQKWLNGWKSNSGYFEVRLMCEEGPHSFLVHRLIYETFQGQIPEGLEVNHISEDNEDNRLCNLNLMTHGDNINYGTHNEKVAAARSKQVNRCDLEGNVLETYPSTMEAERQGSFNHAKVSQCCNGKRKTHQGYLWSYVPL